MEPIELKTPEGYFDDSFARTMSGVARIRKRRRAAVRIADRLGVREPERTAFIQFYQAFKKESADVLSVKPSVTGNAEDDIEAKILADFEKSERILSLRKTYYDKFRAILSPSQIQAMYDIEKEFNTRK